MRYEVTFIGRVQGVGFRAAAKRLSREHAVTGWARNEPDASISIIIEGDQHELDTYLKSLQTLMADFITSTSIEKTPEKGVYSGFEIRS